MDKLEEYWGGFLIIHGGMDDQYRAVAYPRDRATSCGLERISVSHTNQESALREVHERISAAWGPLLRLDGEIAERTSFLPSRMRVNHCHSCKHTVDSKYMPVCKKCERSICLNCRRCMCNYTGSVNRG